MKIRLLSDLHYEFYTPSTFEQEPMLEYCGEDVTVLAGDIACGSQQVEEVLSLFIMRGHKHIVYVPGNHEFYNYNYYLTLDRLIDTCGEFGGKVTLLQPNMHKTIDGVVFFGGTLWTNFGDNTKCEMISKGLINDFKFIQGFTADLCKQLYYEQLESINSIYYSLPTTTQKVIVTHFLPAMECVHPKYAGSKLNQYFANDLGDWIKELKNTTWLFGHTHDTMELELGSTKLYCNPHGYLTENSLGFNPRKIIEV